MPKRGSSWRQKETRAQKLLLSQQRLTHLFLSAAGRECSCLLSPKLSSVLCLLQVEASAKRTHWIQRHMTDPQTYNLPKIPWCSSNAMFGRARLFLLVQENIPLNRLVINPKINFESKGILVLFIPSLIPLQLGQIIKKKTSECGKKKKESDINLQNFPTISTIHHNHDKPLLCPIYYSIYDANL